MRTNSERSIRANKNWFKDRIWSSGHHLIYYNISYTGIGKICVKIVPNKGYIKKSEQ